MKKNVAVIFGGKTCEHDVSIISAHQVLENADKSKYNLIPVYIAPNGQWYTGEKLFNVEFFKAFKPEEATAVYMEANGAGGALYPVQHQNLSYQLLHHNIRKYNLPLSD